jgi:hypothetical protein
MCILLAFSQRCVTTSTQRRTCRYSSPQLLSRSIPATARLIAQKALPRTSCTHAAALAKLIMAIYLPTHTYKAATAWFSACCFAVRRILLRNFTGRSTSTTSITTWALATVSRRCSRRSSAHRCCTPARWHGQRGGTCTRTALSLTQGPGGGAYFEPGDKLPSLYLLAVPAHFREPRLPLHRCAGTSTQ